MTNPVDRPFTRLAASLLGKDNLAALDTGKCPMCKGPISGFRDKLSYKEYGISGMCQKCQDKVFGKPEED